jgi:hypothetical protein
MIQIKKHLTEFKSLINMLNNLNLESNLVFMQDGIFIKVINNSNISMIVAKLKKDLFDKYEINEERIYTIDNTALMKILNILGKKELNMEILPTGIKCSNEKNDNLLLNYYIGQKDERNIPPEGDGPKWKINPGNFINILGESIEIGNIGIFSGNDNLCLNLKSQLINGSLNLDAEKISGIECKSYYDMGEFIYISTLRHIFKEVEFGYDENKCYIKGSNDKIDFKWILAARVPEDG